MQLADAGFGDIEDFRYLLHRQLLQVIEQNNLTLPFVELLNGGGESVYKLAFLETFVGSGNVGRPQEISQGK